MDQHPNLFGADAETELPALVAPRVTAPVKAAPKAQPIALDLFPATGLFADQDDAEADQADEGAALADDQGALADALREEAAELPAMREDSLAATAREIVANTEPEETAVPEISKGDRVKCGFTHYRVVKPVYKSRGIEFVDAVEIRGTHLEGTAPHRLAVSSLVKVPDAATVQLPTAPRTLRITCALPASADQFAQYLRENEVDVERVDGCEVLIPWGGNARFALDLGEQAARLGHAADDLSPVIAQIEQGA